MSGDFFRHWGSKLDQLRSTLPYKSHPSRPLRCNGSRSEVGAVDSEKGDQKRKDGRLIIAASYLRTGRGRGRLFVHQNHQS